jgi:hypothetical protein
MAITINWLTKVITVPQADLTALGGGFFELDVELFRNQLKNLEDDEAGMPFPPTHRRNAPVVLSGVTYAQTFEIINGYTVTFESVGTAYTIKCAGANHNLADVKNINDVSLVVGNSAGLVVGSGGGASAADIAAAVRVEIAAELARVSDLAKIHGLVLGVDLEVTPTSRTAGDVVQTVSEVGTTVTVSRT